MIECELRNSFNRYRDNFISVAIFSGVLNILMLVPAFYMLQVYDRVVASQSLSTLITLSLLALTMFLFLGALDWIRSMVLVQISHKITNQLNSRVFEISFKKTLNYQTQSSALQPLKDLTGIRQFISSKIIISFFDAPWIPIYVGVMFLMHPAIGWFAIISLLCLTSLAIVNELLCRSIQFKSTQKAAIGSSYNQACLRNTESIMAMGMLETVSLRWESYLKDAEVLQFKSSKRENFFSATSKALRFSLQSGVLGLGAYLVIQESLTPALMIGGSLLLGRALSPVDQLIGGWKSFINARKSYYSLKIELKDHPRKPQKFYLHDPKGSIQVDRLIVQPPNSRTPLLKGISFILKPGECAVLSGESGSGKTTLAKAMMGLIPTINGEIRFDGMNISHLADHDRKYFGYLPQQVELFDGTIAENIARFKVNDEKQIYGAAELAGIHKFILQLPEGYDTQLGANGTILSGGQRQLLGLARALYGQPKFIVLDEPDASLDEKGERALGSALEKLKSQNITILIISHKKSILDHADSLLIMKLGVITLGGPRDLVLQKLSSNKMTTHPSSIKNKISDEVEIS